MIRIRRLLARFFARRATSGQRCLALHMHGATYRSALR